MSVVLKKNKFIKPSETGTVCDPSSNQIDLEFHTFHVKQKLEIQNGKQRQFFFYSDILTNESEHTPGCQTDTQQGLQIK